MGKAEPGSLKALSNKMKSKGLQKLRWYCQMCQKQCRDENGFKCHIMSESHQRQMILFADNARDYLDNFSGDFEKEFLKLLRRRFGTRRVKANQVYQEYISDRNHVHMNSTEWDTLTDFVKYLGKNGICEVDETEKGWFIQYIDRDPEVLARQELLRKREMMEMDEEERQKQLLEEQIQRARETTRVEETVFTELVKGEDEKISLNLSLKKQDKEKSPSLEEKPKIMVSGVFQADDATAPNKRPGSVTDAFQPNKRKKTALEEIMEQEEKKKEKEKRKDNWITEGIVVKVINKKLADGAYYKQKGYIKKVHGDYIAEIQMLDSKDIIKIDQSYCETVIPNIGGRVRIVNGAYRGEEAELVALNVDKFHATLKIIHGPYNERVVEAVPYEDFCKVYK